MQIIHNEIVTGLWAVIAAVLFTAGLLSGHWWWPDRNREDSVWRNGYEQGADDEAASFAPCHHQEVMPDDQRITQARPGETRPLVGVPRPVPGGAGERVLPEPAVGGPGRTIYPELAALAADEPGPAATPPAAGPEPPLDAHWYANGLHFLADWQAEWHAEAASFDTWLAVYLQDMRTSLEPSWSRASRLLEAL